MFPLAILPLLALFAAGGAGAQPLPPANGLLLLAKPGLLDPNFSRTVVLVTQTDDASTVGVILNRPLREPLARFLPEEPAAANYPGRVFFGGPVMRQAIVALFSSDTPPRAPAFHVLRGVWLTMHAENIRAVLADPDRRHRFFAGFSGWAPRQLESEFARDGWFVLRADPHTVFRSNTEGMWEELLRKATAPKPSAGGEVVALAAGSLAEPQTPGIPKMKAPPEAGLEARIHRAAPREGRWPWRGGPPRPESATAAALPGRAPAFAVSGPVARNSAIASSVFKD
jgi:putative transcriptional regulator